MTVNMGYIFKPIKDSQYTRYKITGDKERKRKVLRLGYVVPISKISTYIKFSDLITNEQFFLVYLRPIRFRCLREGDNNFQ